MARRQSPLYDMHTTHDATFTEFGGWEMPVEFTSIREEHASVRGAVGVFDVSHMGQIEVSGPDAADLCQWMISSNVADIARGESQYTTILREDGTILDDAILYRVGEERYLLVPNAGQDERMTERWRTHRDDREVDAHLSNRTSEFGMLAVQGPDAAAALPIDVDEIAGMTIVEVEIEGVRCWCSRTGYTGEDGFELMIPWDQTPTVAETIDATCCGLGARDTLRLEMGFVLAGNEFDEDDNRRTPLEARLDFVVDLDSGVPFVGREAVEAQREEGPEAFLSGIAMVDRGIPRHGYDITDGDGTAIGTVTSGTMSPSLNEPIGLGYVDAAHARNDEMIAVSVRGIEKMASIVSPPFVESGR